MNVAIASNRLSSTGVFIVSLLGIGGFGACTVGNGSGHASGTAYVAKCAKLEKADASVPADEPVPYDLDPRFFAGEPIEDIEKNGTENRFMVRLQSSGLRVEDIDLLTFDMNSSYETARCVRGRIDSKTGMPDYDTTACQYPPGSEWPRIRIGPRQLVRVNWIPSATCPQIDDVIASGSGDDVEVNGVPVVTPFDQWESWIDLKDFGSAAQRQLPPEMRSQIDATFKVEFRETLHAPAFHVVLMDDRVLKAPRYHQKAPPPSILGTLDGFFDFDLERGQGAQTFP